MPIEASFYIGSTETRDAWEHATPHDEKVTGVWSGGFDHATIESSSFYDVADILTTAAYLAYSTGNDYVLAVFTVPDSSRIPVEWRARKVDVTATGQECRDLFVSHESYTVPCDGSHPYAFTRDSAGTLAVVLVDSKRNVTGVA